MWTPSRLPGTLLKDIAGSKKRYSLLLNQDITYFANSRINIFKSICNCNQELRGDLLVLNYTKLGPMIQIASMWCHTEQGNTQSCLPPCTMHHRFAPYLPIMHHVSPNIFFSQQNVCKAEHHKHASLIDSQTFSVFHTSFSGEGLQGPVRTKVSLCLKKRATLIKWQVSQPIIIG